MNDYLTKKGFSIEYSYALNTRLHFRKVYEYARRFVLENYYNIVSTNCKSFASTVFSSIAKGVYTFESDEENDNIHKIAASIYDLASTNSTYKYKNNSNSKTIASPSLKIGNVSYFNPLDIYNYTLPKPGNNGRVIDFVTWRVDGYQYFKSKNAKYAISIFIDNIDIQDNIIELLEDTTSLKSYDLSRKIVFNSYELSSTLISWCNTSLKIDLINCYFTFSAYCNYNLQLLKEYIINIKHKDHIIKIKPINYPFGYNKIQYNFPVIQIGIPSNCSKADDSLKNIYYKDIENILWYCVFDKM